MSSIHQWRGEAAAATAAYTFIPVVEARILGLLLHLGFVLMQL